MNWKNWPYWVRGTIISASFILLFSIIISIVVASSSICGFNSFGESHTCNLSERTQAFFGVMRMILILPFIGTFYSILEYHSLKILWQATDGFPVMLIIVTILSLGSGFGWIYGKMKGKNKINNN